MLRTPAHDVDVRERGCALKARTTHRRIRFLVAIVTVHAEEQDRRTCEAQIVHRVAVWHVKRRQCRDDAVATAGNVVQMNEIDRRTARTDPADEVGPWLARPADMIERAHDAVSPVLFDLPGITQGDRKIVAITRARCVDQRTCMVLGSASVTVNHVQHAVAARAGTSRKSSALLRVQASQSPHRFRTMAAHVGSRSAPHEDRDGRRPSDAVAHEPISRVVPVTTNVRSTLVEQAHALRVERVRAHQVLAGQADRREATSARRRIGRFAMREGATPSISVATP